MADKKIWIKKSEVATEPPWNYTLICILFMHVYDMREWAITLVIISLVWLWLSHFILSYNRISVKPLETYNRDAHPEEAFNQDMGIKETTQAKSFDQMVKDKLGKN